MALLLVCQGCAPLGRLLLFTDPRAFLACPARPPPTCRGTSDAFVAKSIADTIHKGLAKNDTHIDLDLVHKLKNKLEGRQERGLLPAACFPLHPVANLNRLHLHPPILQPCLYPHFSSSALLGTA